MLPNEFYELYGRVIYREIVIAAGNPTRIVANPYRYLFGVMWSGAPIGFIPDSSLALMQPTPATVAVNAPVIFTHALHGTLPAGGWSIFTAAATPGVGIVEGFMYPPGVLEGIDRGKAKDVPKQVGDSKRSQRANHRR